MAKTIKELDAENARLRAEIKRLKEQLAYYTCNAVQIQAIGFATPQPPPEWKPPEVTK